MKKILLLLLTTTLGFTGFAQTPYNPYTQNIHFLPEPNQSGINNCGPIDAIFTIGLTTQDDATDWVNNPMIVRICVTGLVINSSSVADAVYGSYSNFFSWSMEGDSCFVGVQNDTLHGTGSDLFNIHPDATGLIGVKLIIPNDLAVPSLVGVDVSLIVPSYMSTFNVISDDPESSYTQNYIGHTTVSGSLFNDPAIGDNPFGALIGTPSNTNMYVNVIDSATSLVEGTSMIPSNGNYLVDSLSVNTTYIVQLSTNQGVKGQTPPPVQLPPNWTFADEDCCDSSASDGIPNGTLENIQATTCPIENANFGISNAIPLPVDLTSFTVSEINCTSFLNWISRNEENVSHYEILRKEANSKSFKTIKKIEVQKQQANLKTYTFSDKLIDDNNDSYAYQLKIVDLDNRASFSAIKAINISCNDLSINGSLAPNPATNEINFHYHNSYQASDIAISILDVSGQLLHSDIREIKNGINSLNISLVNYPKGYYLLNYNDLENKHKGTLQFIIK